MDRRFLQQFGLLLFLIVLPVTMIAFNGVDAVRALWMTDGGRIGMAEDRPELKGSEDGHVDVYDVSGVIAEADESSVLAAESMPAQANDQTLGKHLRFGVYDPRDEFAGDNKLSIRHLYISWAAFDSQRLADSLVSLERNRFEPLLTIEPWAKAGSHQPLLPAILSGQYDDIIDELVEILGQLKGPVNIAWGHEMDQDLTERYPWSGADPEEFVAAYRYFVDYIRKRVDTKLNWGWVGVLKEGSLRYWPGDEYVDFVGMPIYSFPAFDQRTYGFIRDFRTTFDEKRKIVAGLNKPLMITELGVSGSPDFESFWLHQAFMALQDYPDLSAVVFFYARDTEGAWGRDLATPDWRVHPDAIRGLVAWNLGKS